jgi:high-affinity Fe2+/Pb2+ permease
MSFESLLEQIGLKSPALVAGVFGAAASLSYERGIGPGRAVVLILVGAACAGYLTPVIAEWLSPSSSSIENAYAFIIGLLSMRIIGGLITLGERFKEDPAAFIKTLKRRADR